MARRYKSKSYGKYKGKRKSFKRYGKKPRHGTKTVITKYRW